MNKIFNFDHIKLSEIYLYDNFDFQELFDTTGKVLVKCAETEKFEKEEENLET